MNRNFKEAPLVYSVIVYKNLPQDNVSFTSQSLIENLSNAEHVPFYTGHLVNDVKLLEDTLAELSPMLVNLGGTYFVKENPKRHAVSDSINNYIIENLLAARHEKVNKLLPK